jgi:hypothetical protein
MARLPVDDRLLIEQAIEDQVVPGEMRGYLGLSQIGDPCSRKLWYDFRFCSKKEFSARVARLFQRGHREEPIITADLRKAGVKVHSDQAEVIAGYGHIKGHIDGIGENIPDAPKTPHLLEFKTMKEGVEGNTKRQPTYFHKLKAKGVEIANPVYWSQCQCYMRLMKLTRTLFIAINKNTDERYYERIRLNILIANELLKRGEEIILSEFPLPRLPATNGKTHNWKCNFCDQKEVCLEGAEPLRNCRTCRYCDIENEGKWSCSEKGDSRNPHWLSLEDQISGCLDWRKMKGLGV